MKVLITGGAGFIGSAVIRQLINESDHDILNVDALTYAGNVESLESIKENRRYHFVRADICSYRTICEVVSSYKPNAIMHLAAESHVDRSIDGPAVFIQTNIVGTYNVLQAMREYWTTLKDTERENFIFHHISTDEVFGSASNHECFTEKTAYKPSSPYSASKASSDHLVRAWYHTFGLPVVISNCSNNYGPYQFPEKLIPLMILNGLQGKSLPVYGKGENIRDWLFVDDHARALRLIIEKGKPGESYNIGGNSERKNIEVVKSICCLLDEYRPKSDFVPHEKSISFVQDRPGHDLRYAIDAKKIERELGWKPTETFESGLRKTFEWYLSNEKWWRRVQDGSYRGERLGLGIV